MIRPTEQRLQQQHAVHRFDAVTIAGLTGEGRGDSTNGRGDYHHDENDDDDDDRRDVRSDTLSSIRDSDAGSLISVLSDDLGDIYFTDDELDNDDDYDGGSRRRRQEDRHDHSVAIVALTTEADEDDDDEETNGKSQVDVSVVHGMTEIGRCSRANRSVQEQKITVSLGARVIATPAGQAEASARAERWDGEDNVPVTAHEITPATPADVVIDETEGHQSSPPGRRYCTPATTSLSPLAQTSRRASANGAGLGVGMKTVPARVASSPEGSKNSGNYRANNGVNQHSHDAGDALKETVTSSYATPPAVGFSTNADSGSPAEAKVHVPTITCKVLVVGNAKCGKSSIISRFVSNRFSPDYNSTVGADYAMKDVALNDGRRVGENN